MLNIIGWALFGLVCGVVGKLVMGVHMGLIWTILLGIAGSFVGGFIGGLFTKEKDMLKPHPSGWIMSIIGSIVVIFVASRLGIGG